MGIINFAKDPKMTFIYVMPIDEEYNGYSVLENRG